MSLFSDRGSDIVVVNRKTLEIVPTIESRVVGGAARFRLIR
jgi:hypothetical protein